MKIEEEERKLEAEIEEIEKQNAEVNADMKELELKTNKFKELEERYFLYLIWNTHCVHFSFRDFLVKFACTNYIQVLA